MPFISIISFDRLNDCPIRVKEMTNKINTKLYKCDFSVDGFGGRRIFSGNNSCGTIKWYSTDGRIDRSCVCLIVDTSVSACVCVCLDELGGNKLKQLVKKIKHHRDRVAVSGQQKGNDKNYAVHTIHKSMGIELAAKRFPKLIKIEIKPTHTHSRHNNI